MMKQSTEDTVTVTKLDSSASMENRWNDGHSYHALARAESNTAARKRRMTEQPMSKTPKTARRHEIDNDNSRVLNKSVSAPGTKNCPKSDCNVGSSTNRTSHLDQLQMALNDDYVEFDNDINNGKNRNNGRLSEKPPHHPDVSRKFNVTNMNRRNDSARLRKTIQWLVEGSTKLRENIAEVRRELHEEKKNSCMARKEIEVAVKEAKAQESSKYQQIIAELKIKLSQISSRPTTGSSTSSISIKDENYSCELAVTKKRLAEANETIRKLKSNSLYSNPGCVMKKPKSVQNGQLQQIKSEEGDPRRVNKLLEEKPQMKKLRDSEGGHGIHLAPGIKVKIPQVQNAMDLCKSECEAVNEVIRLRELAVEQQEMIEYLHQVLKERERKLDQLSNKRRKEEFYKQWLELEPVAEVIDEEEHEEGDSGLSTAPSSLSLQPGGWQANGVTREAYETLLLEVDELHTQYAEEQQELAHAKSQVRDLEKALLQETRGSQNSRRALSAKLNEAEEREGCLLAEISELREQNELLEFRVLELEESEPRESPDTADSGVVSPEPSPQLFKDHGNSKQRDRAIATVIPYCNSSSPIPVHKSPLSLQESGIFDDDDEHDVILASCGTQTDTPAGELLQEVQRLQELRERIQERAAKVPTTPVDTYEIVDDNRLSLYKQKIRELEERLDKFAMADQKRSHDESIAKQREEDLLDENYRLTERVYWLENELRKYNDTRKYIDIGTMTTNFDVRDSFSMTDDTISKYEDMSSVFNFISSLSRCQKIVYEVLDVIHNQNFCFNSKILNVRGIVTEPCPGNNFTTKCSNCDTSRANYNEKIQLLSQAECCLRREIAHLEHKEGVFSEIFRQCNTTKSQLEIDHDVRLEGNRQKSMRKAVVDQSLTAKISESANCIENQSCCDNSVNRDEVDNIHNAFKSDSLNFSNTVEKKCENDESMNMKNKCDQMESDQIDCNKAECVFENSAKLLKEGARQSQGKEAEKQRWDIEVSSVRIHHAENSTDNCKMINKFDAKEKDNYCWRCLVCPSDDQKWYVLPCGQRHL